MENLSKRIKCPRCNSAYFFHVNAWEGQVGCLDCDTLYTPAQDTRPAELITAIASYTVGLASMGAV